MRVVLLGPPGAGKGTLASLLKDRLGAVHISTGDLLREEMKRGTDLGREVKKFIENGKLVPDEVVTSMIENKLTHDKDTKRGFMLDGFPRTTAQADDLDKILTKLRRPLNAVLYLECELAFIVRRLTGRRVCRKCGAVFHVINRPPQKANICDDCGGELYQRSDDKEETIKTRIDVYLKSTLPIVEHYETQGKLKRLNGNQESEDLLEILLKEFNENGTID